MDTQAQLLRQNRYVSPLARPWVARMIAMFGIIGMTVGLYVPFAGRDSTLNGDPASRRADTWALRNVIGPFLSAFLPHVGRISLPRLLGVDVVLSVLTLGGLALIPLLWRPLSPRWTAGLRWTFAAWLSLLVIWVVVSLPAWWLRMSEPLAGTPAFITFGAPYLLPGVAVFPLGVLVSGAALLLLFREPLPASSPAIAPRTGWQWAAALTITAGALVWGVGFYLMPEAITAACPPVTFSVTQFAHGACAGLDSDQVLQNAYYAGLNPLAFLLYTLGRNFELLVAAGCLTALGGWARQLSGKTLVWLAAWPALAFGVAFVALQGVNVVAQHGFQLTIVAGSSWHMAAGMVVTFVGIGLVVLGQLGLWREMVRRRGVASAR